MFKNMFHKLSSAGIKTVIFLMPQTGGMTIVASSNHVCGEDVSMQNMRRLDAFLCSEAH